MKMGCELCGKEGELVEAKIEGTVLEVCENCAELGEVLQRGQVKKKQRSKQKLPHQPEQVLANNYGQAVRRARENREMDIAQLAEKMKEKESVIRRVENEKLKPPKKLARKLENFLNVSLYEDEAASPVTSKSNKQTEGVTLGDVAEVEHKKES